MTIKLNQLTDLVCPDCGCSEVRSEGRKNQGVGGLWREHREFTCNKALEFSPNFMRVEETHRCMRSKSWKANREKRTNLKVKILKLADKASVLSEQELERLESHLDYWRWG